MNKQLINEIIEESTVINAAGKMTALGGSAQHSDIANTQAEAAKLHVDLARLRYLAGEAIAAVTGAESACLTTGAAAGICIGVAAMLTGTDSDKAQRLPEFEGENRILLQAGHAVNFGASVEQMIRLGGGDPTIVGTTESVSQKLLSETLERDQFAGFVYVQSHHCIQENRVDLKDCIALCQQHRIPLLVDAAAEEDLTHYISLGADLVTYSGGKAIGGPTSGFIAGRKDLIEACELQFQGIARPMKVGKEQILGLLYALQLYEERDKGEVDEEMKAINSLLLSQLQQHSSLDVQLREDEAGRGISRVAVAARDQGFPIKDLLKFMKSASPSIRTRNHHIDKGFFQIDPREIDLDKAEIIASTIKAYLSQL